MEYSVAIFWCGEMDSSLDTSKMIAARGSLGVLSYLEGLLSLSMCASGNFEELVAVAIIGVLSSFRSFSV
eukprot:3850-Ditylum_brightwellii.AAC.1